MPMRFPSVGKLLADRGLDRASVVATGRLGQLLKGDVLKAKPRAASSQPQARPVAAPVAAAVSGLGKSVPHHYAFTDARMGVLLQEAAAALGAGGLAACVLRSALPSLGVLGLDGTGTALVERVTRGGAQRAVVRLGAGPQEVAKALQGRGGLEGTSAALVIQDYSETGVGSVTGVLPPGAVALLTIGAPSVRAAQPQSALAATLGLSADATLVSEEQAQQFLEGVASNMKSFGLV